MTDSRHILQQQMRQSQSLTLTPSMILSLHVLQLPAAELEEYLRQETEANPVVEVQSPDLSLSPSPTPALRAQGGAGVSATAYDIPDRPLNSLYDDLMQQISWLSLPPEIRKAAGYLIGNLEPDGYLRVPWEEVECAAGIPAAALHAALDAIHACDPPGVGARSAQECLWLQSCRKYGRDALVTQMIARCWPQLLHPHLSSIARTLQTGLAEVRAAIASLTGLSLEPGAVFGAPPVDYMQPDVLAVRAHGVTAVEINADIHPRLQYVREYVDMKRQTRDPQVQAFLRSAWIQASWLKKAMRMREQTLLSVSRTIIGHQEGFCFESHPLLPLSVKTVAQQTGFHESTVRRAIAGKAVQVPRGIVLLPRLLSEAVAVSTASVDMIMNAIQDAIARENPACPLSDADIARLLARSGTPLARRTVAKYRTQMGFPPSPERRRL